MIKQSIFIEKFTKWSEGQYEILGAALVGSQARGTAREDSDVDLIIITSNPLTYLKSKDWLNEFGSVRKIKDEDYGLLQSRRVYYSDGLEVEFGLTTAEWLKTDPIDAGTKRVMTDGHKVLTDKTGLFSKFALATK